MVIGDGLLVNEVRFLVWVRIVILAALSLVGVCLFLQRGCMADLYLGGRWHHRFYNQYQVVKIGCPLQDRCQFLGRLFGLALPDPYIILQI